MKSQLHGPKLIKQKSLLLCLFIFLAGIFTGFFFTFIIPEADKLYLSAALKLALTSRALGLPAALLCNLTYLILIFLLGLSIFGAPLILPLLLFKAAALGMCLVLASSAPLFSVFISINLLLSLVYMSASAISLTYSTPRLLQQSHNTELLKPYIVCFAILVPVITVISFAASMLL